MNGLCGIVSSASFSLRAGIGGCLAICLVLLTGCSGMGGTSDGKVNYELRWGPLHLQGERSTSLYRCAAGSDACEPHYLPDPKKGE